MSSGEAPEPPASLAPTLKGLAVDLVTAEVVAGLRELGVHAILLKGPSFARWLYDERALRPYNDCDLFVSPDDFKRAEELLETTGFRRFGIESIPGDWPRAARTWVRGDGEAVDLHHTFVGIGVSDADAWAALSGELETMRVGGVDVDVLPPAARAMTVALHAAKDGSRVAKAVHDLGHAVERLPEEVWTEAAALATRLEAGAAFVVGLRRSPAGAALAERLQLSYSMSVATALRAEGAPPLAIGIDWFLNERGVCQRALLVVRKLFPPPTFLRAWKPVARKGPGGLAVAFAWRPFWVVWHVGPALRAWWRARRISRRTRSSLNAGRPDRP